MKVPTKDNFTRVLSLKEMINELEISKDNIAELILYRAFSVSIYEDLELHLKRKIDSCFVNNYFYIELKAWKATMEICWVKSFQIWSFFWSVLNYY